MDDPLTPDNRDSIVEDALRTYPLAGLPRDITPGVMARIQTMPAPRRFRLTGDDLALGLAIVVSAGAILFAVQNLPPLVLAQLRVHSVLFYQRLLVNAGWLVPAAMFGFAALLAALAIPLLIQMMKVRRT